MYKIPQKEVDVLAAGLAKIISLREGSDVNVYPVPRGGVPAAYLVRDAFKNIVPQRIFRIVNDPTRAHVFIDDLIDSGATRSRYEKEYPDTPFYGLIDKSWYRKNQPSSPLAGWIVFPWENSVKASAEDIPTRLLQLMGEDVERGGLLETPRRFLKAWKHYTSGYDKDPADILKVFKDGAENYDEMVLVRDIPVYSQCEHHLAPFFGVAHVGYIPSKAIVGLSKLSRLVDMYARRLQVQERLTNQIADALQTHLDPLGVAVVLECRHMCMESRGICQQGHKTITSAMRGALKEKTETRMEFLELIR